MPPSSDPTTNMRMSRRRMLGGIGSLSSSDLRALGKQWIENAIDEALRVDQTPKPVRAAPSSENK